MTKIKVKSDSNSDYCCTFAPRNGWSREIPNFALSQNYSFWPYPINRAIYMFN